MSGHAAFAQWEPDQPCRWCHFYGGVAWGDVGMAWCERGRRHVRAQPERGCPFYEREPGVDDDWTPPPPDDGPTPWQPIRPPYPRRPPPDAPRPGAAPAQGPVTASA